MININPFELMWQYITFRWEWKQLNWKERARLLLMYPILVPFFAFVLAYAFGVYYTGKSYNKIFK